MRGGAVHIQEIEKARNSSDYPASGMPPKQNKGAAQRRSTNIPTPRKRQKTIVPIGGMLFYLGGMFFFLLEVNFFPYLFFKPVMIFSFPLTSSSRTDSQSSVETDLSMSILAKEEYRASGRYLKAPEYCSQSAKAVGFDEVLSFSINDIDRK
jgi:hypothetical protein